MVGRQQLDTSNKLINLVWVILGILAWCLRSAIAIKFVQTILCPVSTCWCWGIPTPWLNALSRLPLALLHLLIGILYSQEGGPCSYCHAAYLPPNWLVDSIKKSHTRTTNTDKKREGERGSWHVFGWPGLIALVWCSDYVGRVGRGRYCFGLAMASEGTRNLAN